MYKCLDCDYVFAEPAIERQHEVIDGQCYTSLEWEVCPSCGGEMFKEAQPCKLCGEWNTDYEWVDACEDCRKKLRARRDKLYEDNFTQLEMDILADAYDEEE